MIRSRKPLVIQDAQTDPRTEQMSGISRARGTRAIMIVPMLSRGEATRAQLPHIRRLLSRP